VNEAEREQERKREREKRERERFRKNGKGPLNLIRVVFWSVSDIFPPRHRSR
jgi:hypothetical protein